jgi:hypothetical protein
MATCRIIETGATPEQYDKVRERLGLGEGGPPGCTTHIAARGEDGTIRIVEVWDSQEQAAEFGEKVREVREDLGVGGGEPPKISYLEVYKFIG